MISRSGYYVLIKNTKYELDYEIYLSEKLKYSGKELITVSLQNKFLSGSFLSKVLNAIYIFIKFPFLKYAFSDGVILFGSNLYKLFFPLVYVKRLVMVVYNELPNIQLDKKLNVLDRILILLNKGKIYVSSNERRDWLLDQNLIIAGVIPNIKRIDKSVIKINANINIVRNCKNIIYAGIVTEKRINIETLKVINRYHSLHVYGPLVNHNKNLNQYFTYCGNHSSDYVQRKMFEYRYALLSYSTEDVNNAYCAPIKIFEYIDASCICITVNNNIGLNKLLSDYPALICHIDKLDNYDYNEVEYNLQRDKFFEEHNSLMKSALSMIISG